MRYYFKDDIVTMRIDALGNSPYNVNNWGTGLYVTNTVLSDRGDKGIESGVVNSSSSYSGRAIGITGYAGNATSGYNYGVIGSLMGSNNGAGIFGNSTGDFQGIYIDGYYAGYFSGNLKVTGTINGTVVGNSDIRFKQNIEELGSTVKSKDVLNSLTRLAPISYNYKQIYYDVKVNAKSDTLEKKAGMFDEKSQMFGKKHFGLIAQDLQEIYPDLVYENDNGYLSVNYIEIIPLLIQSIKELKEEIDVLSGAFVNIRTATPNDFPGNIPRAVLFQNAPNPFTATTEIKFELPDNISGALIIIFNMQGALVKQIPIRRQQQSVTIDGSELAAGMYFYSLVVDGKEIDTKRMILTK